MKARILLIEDNELNRDLVEQLLEDEYDVISRADGAAGLAAARESVPDLVLLDLSLPVMDGWEVARRMRQDPVTTRVPIVALTAHAMPGDAERALEAGCDAYLTKPLDEDRLFATIMELLADG